MENREERETDKGTHIFLSVHTLNKRYNHFLGIPFERQRNRKLVCERREGNQREFNVLRDETLSMKAWNIHTPFYCDDMSGCVAYKLSYFQTLLWFFFFFFTLLNCTWLKVSLRLVCQHNCTMSAKCCYDNGFIGATHLPGSEIVDDLHRTWINTLWCTQCEQL